MSKTTETIYTDFHKGRFFYSREKKIQDDWEENGENGKIQEPDSRDLHNLFVTAIENQGEDEIRIQTADKSRYQRIAGKYGIRGISLETKKVSAYEYGYIVRIKPKTLLAEADRFRCTW